MVYRNTLESAEVEFKEKIPEDSSKYTKTVVAFANGNGGQIIFGVEDKTHSILGLTDCNLFTEADRISNAISDSVYPSVNFSIDIREIENIPLLIVNVLPGESKPYRIKSLGPEEGVFVRMGGTTRVADKDISSELFYENKNLSWDCLIYNNKEFSGKEMQLFNENVSPNISFAQMRSWNLIKERDGKQYITNAFALLTGIYEDSPSIQCALFRGKDKSEFLDRKVFDGPLLKNYKNVVKFLLANTRTLATIEGFSRREQKEIPDEILREFAVNAVVHRSYISFQSSFIGIYSDRIEIITPGILPSGITLQKMKEGFSKIRNKAITNVFMNLNIMEGWGSGIPRIIKISKKYGLKEPKIEDIGTGIKVTVYRENFFYYKDELRESSPAYIATGKGKDEVMNLIKCNPFITQQELSNALNLSLSTIKRICLKLTTDGILERVGNNRAGYWKLL